MPEVPLPQLQQNEVASCPYRYQFPSIPMCIYTSKTIPSASNSTANQLFCQSTQRRCTAAHTFSETVPQSMDGILAPSVEALSSSSNACANPTRTPIRRKTRARQCLAYALVRLSNIPHNAPSSQHARARLWEGGGGPLTPTMLPGKTRSHKTSYRR
jgi:hypothetical protein